VPVLLPGAQWLRGWLPPWAAERIDFGGETPQVSNPGDGIPSSQTAGA